jgi:hypothetical protein
VRIDAGFDESRGHSDEQRRALSRVQPGHEQHLTVDCALDVGTDGRFRNAVVQFAQRDGIPGNTGKIIEFPRRQVEDR